MDIFLKPYYSGVFLCFQEFYQLRNENEPTVLDSLNFKPAYYSFQ